MASSGQPTLLEHTWKVYAENFNIILLLALPGLLALLVPLAVGTPIYISLGGLYLRTGSIPDLTSASAGVMLATVLLSVFLMSFALASINLVIKSERTMTHIGKEVIRSLTTTALSVFWVFLFALLAFFIIQLVTYEYRLQAILSPLLSFALGLALLFVPTALVIDEVRPWRALELSVKTLVTKLPLVGLWLVITLLLLSLADGLFLWLLPHPLASWLALLFNSLIVLPFIVVMLGQIYISKYTILA